MNDSAYRQLIQLYPPRYRARHGDEILSTLVAAQRSPFIEAVPIALHAIETRYAEATARSLRVTLVHTLQIMCLLAVAAQSASLPYRLVFATTSGHYDTIPAQHWVWSWAPPLLCVYALGVTLAVPRKWLAVPGALLSALYTACDLNRPLGGNVYAQSTALAAVILVFVAAGKSHYRSRLLFTMYAVMFALMLASHLPGQDRWSVAPLAGNIYFACASICLATAAIMAVRDPRLALGLAAYLFWRVTLALILSGYSAYMSTLYWLGAASVVAVIALARSRRRAAV